MDFLFEVIVKLILDILLIYPGAFIRWIIHKKEKRKDFRYYLKDVELNSALMLALISIILIIVFVF